MDCSSRLVHSDQEAKAATSNNNYRRQVLHQTYGYENYGPIDVTVPKGWATTFTPTIVPKGSRKLVDVRGHDHQPGRRKAWPFGMG